MDRDELANFLKHKREGLTPADVGLEGTDRRRTPGLRREEVASLAHVSTDFYTRLEQNRGAGPSEPTTGSLGRAQRTLHPPEDHPMHSRIFAAELRAAHSRPGEDPEADALAELWCAGAADSPRSGSSTR